MSEQAKTYSVAIVGAGPAGYFAAQALQSGEILASKKIGYGVSIKSNLS